MRLELCCVVFLIINQIVAYDLYEGTDFGSRMSYAEVKKQGLLFFKRYKMLSFTYPEGTKITGIACVDLTPIKHAVAKITKGGVNADYVEISLQSERSYGLRYIIEIYTKSYNFTMQ